MSQSTANTEEIPQKMIELKELATLLVKHFDFHDGLWDVSFELNVGIGQFGPTPEASLPGAVLGISRVGLSKALQKTPRTVDAGEVNPA